MVLDPRLLVLAIPSAICLVITAIRWRYHLRKAARADASAAVSGTVVAETDEPVAELVLDLKIPRSTSGMSVDETGRALHTRPFMVKTDAGELIDVEPPVDVVLHANLGKPHKLEHLKRYTRSARIAPGEQIHLLGELRDAATVQGGPFREGERAHRSIAPTLISIERLGGTGRRAAANDRKWLIRWAVMTVLGPIPYVVPVVPLFVVAFWIREMIVANIWWEKVPYREFYGAGSREDRREYG